MENCKYNDKSKVIIMHAIIVPNNMFILLMIYISFEVKICL